MVIDNGKKFFMNKPSRFTATVDNLLRMTNCCVWGGMGWGHGLRTPNEGINQSYLKN